MKSQKNKAFTLIELLTVIAIVAVLAAILMPAISKVRENAAQSKTFSNMRQLVTAVNSFAVDNKGNIPIGDQSADGEGGGGRGFFWVNAIAPTSRSRTSRTP